MPIQSIFNKTTNQEPRTYSNSWFLVFFISFSCNFICSCNHTVGAPEHFTIIDTTIEMRGNIRNVYLTKSTDGSNDAVFYVFNQLNATVYEFDKGLNLISSKKYNVNLLNHCISISSNDSSFFVFSDRKLIKMNQSNFAINNIYSYDSSGRYAYLSLFDNSFNSIDKSFYTLKVPNLNLTNKKEYKEYFNANIIAKGQIYEPDIVKFKRISKVRFPTKYKEGYYGDVFPIYCSDSKRNLYYTYGHWDSIAALINNKIYKTAIPEEFATKSPPFPTDKIKDLIYYKQYSVKYPSNLYMLNADNHILLFQSVGIPDYNNKEGSLKELVDCQKRILLFNKTKKRFESKYYLLPAGYRAFKSIIFDNNLLIFTSKNNKLQLYEIHL